MAANYNPEKATESAFAVINDLGQHALWPAELDLPAGWRRRTAAMPRRACLEAIGNAWRDIAPASIHAAASRPRDARPVHELFAEQASRRPGAAAIVAAETRLTYRELDESANRLARYLRDLGAGPEALIGVHLERGAEAVRSLLAVMKAGSGYLPLDPSLPSARLARICAEARPIAILADRAEKKLSEACAKVLTIGELSTDLAHRPATAPEVSLHPDNTCYVIHTSGSTGHPKVVSVSHGNISCVINEISREYQISPSDRVAQLASLAFDTSVEQVLVTLTSGATVMLPAAGTIAPTDLLRYLEHQRITVIDLTPAYWHQLLAVTTPDDRRLRSIRLMITGGDRADPADCRAALLAAPAARLLNAYGLTETTITSSLFDISAEPEAIVPAGPVPVGKPIGHTRLMVLDDALKPVPSGATGEIYVGGCAVARGYIGRPALTAELFLPDSGGAPGSRMYRTGDLGRWREDGNLELTGRIDRQLKVHGFRVEPAEIESALAGHPDIAQATVVASDQGPSGTRLAAYYTLAAGIAADDGGHPPPSTASLRHFLSDRLPGYMMPAEFVAVDELPLTPDGAPAGDTPWRPLIPPPTDRQREQRTPAEVGVSSLWSELLNREQISLDDDFFALGGDSLLAAEMLTRTRVMFGIGADQVRPLTRCLLRDPTLRGFAKAAQDARAGRRADEGAETRVDFALEAELGVPVRLGARLHHPQPGPRSPRQILLTGSTGFFGAHLLRELLDATTARIWCLVRARDTPQALQRIADAAARYQLPGLPSDRVVPLPGDLGSPFLGLSPGEFQELARSTDIIYHAGASVNFIYPFAALRAANVTGTREVIRLAGIHQGIPVHYVSTTAVLAGLGAMGVREATEDTPLAHPDRLHIGYVETKFVAEELLRNAGQAGLPVAIYRPLDIVGSSRTGAWNTATEMCALIRFITDTGLAPDIPLPLDFVPADICAAAVRHISMLEGATGHTYHLASPRYALLETLVGRLREFGFTVSEIPLDAWVTELLRYAAHNPSHPMTSFLPLFIDRDQESGLTLAEMYLEHIFPHYTQLNTERALKGSGITLPPVDDRLLDRNIGRLIATGYLAHPGDTRLPRQQGPGQEPERPPHAG